MSTWFEYIKEELINKWESGFSSKNADATFDTDSIKHFRLVERCLSDQSRLTPDNIFYGGRSTVVVIL